MKLKKKIVVLLLVIFIMSSLSNLVFAVASENEANKSKVTNEVKNEISNEQNEENSKSNENQEKSENTDDLKDENDNIMLISEEPKQYNKTVLSEVRECSNQNLEYDGYYIDGNVFILSGKKVRIKDSEIVGNLIITADEISVEDTVVNGTLFLCASEISLDVTSDSSYVMGKTIEFDRYTHIKKDLRIFGEDVRFSGTGGRDVAIFGKNVKVTDDAKIFGNCYVEAEKMNIAENSVLGEIKTKNIEYLEGSVSLNIKENLKNRLFDSLANIIIVLVIAIFILGGFPKFTEVNNRLRFRDFVKSFFTGFIELIFIFVIAILIMITGHGIGYSFALIVLGIVFACLGKTLFIIATAIRAAGNPKRVSKIKVFFMTIVVCVGVEAIGYISLFGYVRICNCNSD